MRPIRVLIADDHPDVLTALASVVEDDPRFVVVGTATTGHEAVRLATGIPVDLALLDVHMPGGGLAAVEALKELPAAPVVVAISAQSAPSLVDEMAHAGASGYVVKGHVGEALPDVLARCAAGEVVLPRQHAPVPEALQSRGTG